MNETAPGRWVSLTPETEPDRRRFGRNVARLRQEAGLKQADLADRMVELGCSNWRQATVSRVEHGDQKKITLQEVLALEQILGSGISADTAGGEAVSQALQHHVGLNPPAYGFGNCPTCGKPIGTADQIIFTKIGAAVHYTCHPKYRLAGLPRVIREPDGDMWVLNALGYYENDGLRPLTRDELEAEAGPCEVYIDEHGNFNWDMGSPAA